MAPVPGPCISEPTLCVGFCIALESVGAIAGHGSAGKKTEKPAATSEARGTAERVEAALPQHRFLLPQRAASASLVLARHPVLRRPRSLSLPLCGEGPGTFAAWLPPWGCTPPRPPKKKSNRKNREKCLERLFFHQFFRFSTVDSGVPEPP